VVHGVAQEVDAGRVELFDDGLVEFGILAREYEFGFPAQGGTGVAHQPAVFGKAHLDGQHAQAEDLVAQQSGQPLDLFGHVTQFQIAPAQGQGGEPGLGNAEFAHPVHQDIEFGGRDGQGTDAVVGFAGRGSPRGGHS